MINNPNPCTGLNEAVELQGEKLYELDNVWKSTNDVIVQAIIDNFDSLAWLKGDAIEEMKMYADSLVSAFIANRDIHRYMQRTITLVAKPARGQGALNASEKAELDTIEQYGVYPTDLRNQQDIEEAAINSVTDFGLVMGALKTAKSNLDSVV